MRKFLLLTLLTPVIIFSQDTSYVIIKNDSLNLLHESERNYIGINLSPMVAGLLTNQTSHNIKVSTMYKRNFGYHNMRFSFNYLKNVSNSNFDFNMPVLTTSIHLSFTDILIQIMNTLIFRLGFEELRSYSSSRVVVGVDLIVGYGQQKSNYFHNVW